jgi:V8-like Glu-specific endopeptidase
MKMTENLKGLCRGYFLRAAEAEKITQESLKTAGTQSMLQEMGHIREKAGDGDGLDERMEWYELKSALMASKPAKRDTESGEKVIEQVERNIHSVVMVVSAKNIELLEGRDDVVRIASLPLYERKVDPNLPICKNGKYARQQSAKCIGTGFFVDENVIATAGHVAVREDEGDDIRDLRFVHMVIMRDGDDFKNGFVVSKRQVYRPTAARLRSDRYQWSSMGSDWALIKVRPAYPNAGEYDRVVPTVLRLSPIAEQEQLYSLGHGLGLAAKLSYNGKVIQNNPAKDYFECNLTVLGGNSGSPVIDAQTHEVVGIYVRGTKKLHKSDAEDCLLVKDEDSQWEGQECQRLTPVLEALKTISKAKKQPSKPVRSQKPALQPAL